MESTTVLYRLSVCLAAIVHHFCAAFFSFFCYVTPAYLVQFSFRSGISTHFTVNTDDGVVGCVAQC